ncbi:MAG TPA: response regulator [Pyrinomonadaceae bacterium]|nr:response regulator [Pyrinomonadaceae bacterium]
MVAGRRPTLLLADDSVATQKVISLTFGDEGYEVTTVSDGHEALEFLRENAPPDIVLADCLMPGLNGYELCERVKTDTRWRHIPVLLLVGIFEPFNEAEARRVGADDVLTKPFQSIRDLMSKVGSMLGGGGKTADEPPPHERERHEPPREPSPQPAPEPRTDSHAAESSEVASDPFADLGSDDQMIEATPAEGFGTQEGQTRYAMPEHAEPFDEQDTFSRFPTGADKHEAPAAQDASDDIGEETLITTPVAASAPAPAVSPAGTFSRQMAGAAAADDTLLDLGDIEPPPSTLEADDFILDLSDETPAPSLISEPSPTPVTQVADNASAFAEAAHGESETHAPLAFSPTIVEAETVEVEEATGSLAETDMPGETSEMRGAQPFIEPTVVASEAPVPVGMEGSRVNRGAEGDVARPPVRESVDEDVAAGASVSASAAGSGAGVSQGLITLEQLSPEVIDAVARRAVELLSERVVQEIAWEVVPQLAELMIRRRLDEK